MAIQRKTFTSRRTRSSVPSKRRPVVVGVACHSVATHLRPLAKAHVITMTTGPVGAALVAVVPRIGQVIFSSQSVFTTLLTVFVRFCLSFFSVAECVCCSFVLSLFVAVLFYIHICRTLRFVCLFFFLFRYVLFYLLILNIFVCIFHVLVTCIPTLRIVF